MNINLINKPFNYIVIDDFYDKDELLLLMQEVEAFEPYTLSSDLTDTARTNDGVYKKTGRGFYPGKMFIENRSASKILKVGRKIFTEELNTIFTKFDPSFGHILNSNQDETLVNYYKNGEEYLPHKDTTSITAVTFLSVGDFTGGDFYFPDYDETVLFKHNRIVLFHGCINHQAKPIETKTSSYRVSISHFIGYR
jgi:hypothetical protein